MHLDPVSAGGLAEALVRSNQCCNCVSVFMKAALCHFMANLENNRCSERTRGSIIPREIEMQIPMKCCICAESIHDITKTQAHLREHKLHEFARRERAEENTGGSKCRRSLQAGEVCGRKHESAEALREHREEGVQERPIEACLHYLEVLAHISHHISPFCCSPSLVWETARTLQQWACLPNGKEILTSKAILYSEDNDRQDAQAHKVRSTPKQTKQMKAPWLAQKSHNGRSRFARPCSGWLSPPCWKRYRFSSAAWESQESGTDV